jgi:hypothetical protein
MAGSVNIDETIYRGFPVPPPATPIPGQVFSDYFLPVDHPYLRYEPLRKMTNSVTPVSDSFLVLLTFGFFEVENPDDDPLVVPHRLGRELFDQVPGDLRVQHGMVIDRSKIVAGFSDNDPVILGRMNITNNFLDREPWHTRTVGDAHMLDTSIVVEGSFDATLGAYVVFNGRTQRIDPTGTAGYSHLHLGQGDFATNNGDGETIQITAATQMMNPDANGNLTVPDPGRIRLTLAAPLSHYHGGSSMLSNVVFGNPGPQPLPTMELLHRNGLIRSFRVIDP